MNIRNRIRRIERERDGSRERPVIFYRYHEVDGLDGREAAHTKALAEWEATNGPLGDRDPIYVATRYELRRDTGEMANAEL